MEPMFSGGILNNTITNPILQFLSGISWKKTMREVWGPVSFFHEPWVDLIFN